MQTAVGPWWPWGRCGATRVALSRFLSSLAEAYVAGVPVDWSALFAGTARGGWICRRTPSSAERSLKASVGGEIQDVTTDDDGRRVLGRREREDLYDLAEVLDIADAGAGAEARLPTLSAWRKSRRKQLTLDSWRYSTTWRANALRSGTRLSGKWLIVAPGGDAPVEEVRQALVAAGAEVSVLKDLDQEALSDASGVVSLLAWDEESAFASTLGLVQAHGDGEVPLWVLTRGAAAVGADDPVSAVQTQVWALGQIVGLEQPGSWGGLVDVPVVWDERVTSSLAAVLAAGGVRIRSRCARRACTDVGWCVPRSAPNPAPVRQWNPSGTALITGGTGGIGGHLARWLAKEGVERLLLLSRSGEQAEGAAELAEELRESGAEVTIAACDVTDRTALAELIAGIPAEHPLTAVFHPRVAVHGSLAELDTAGIEDQIAVRVLGARHLDELTTELGVDLDAFVVFSRVLRCGAVRVMGRMRLRAVSWTG